MTPAAGEPTDLFQHDLRPRPFRRDGLAGRIAPFAAVTAVGFAMVVVPPRPSVVAAFVALSTVIAIAAAIVWLPWDRLPRWTDAVPPLAYFLFVAVLRDSQGGAVSGYAALYLVPVVWLALYGAWAHVVVAIGGVASTLAAPLLFVGGEAYPSGEWRRVVIMTGVAWLVGWATYTAMEVLRQQSREVVLLQRASQVLAGLRTPDEVVETMLAAVVDLAGPVESDRRAQLFRIDGDSVEIAAERDETGRRALGLRFALADHDDLATAVRERTARLEGTHVYVPLLVDGALYGVLGATSRRGLAQANRVTRIATIGNIGALALANALVHERLVDENASLQEVSERDALTGLPNRRAWEGWIGGLGAEGADGGCPLDVGIIDLDHFKAFNDTHGHGAGDELLRAAAEGWVGVLRRGDLLARIGGEEFAFLVLDAPTGVAAQLAERLRASMPPGSTCSIGLARRRPGEPITAAMARADVALYRAKGAGRDRIEVADA